MECRIGCGACCIVLSIPEAFPGYPNGKPAFERCVNLTAAKECSIYEDRPPSCREFKAQPSACGASFEEAMQRLESRGKLAPMPAAIVIRDGRIWRAD